MIDSKMSDGINWNDRICGRCYRETSTRPATCDARPEDEPRARGLYTCPDCGAWLLAGLYHPPICGACAREAEGRAEVAS